MSAPASADDTANFYTCCKCYTPTRLDPSLLDGSPYEEVVGALTEPIKSAHRSGVDDHGRDASSATGLDSRTDRRRHGKSAIPIQDSFVLLSKSQVASLHLTSVLPGNRGGVADAGAGGGTDDSAHLRGSLSHKLKTAAKLFDLVSQATDVDHPLCEDCADELMVKLEKRVHEARKEKDAYEAYFKALMEEEHNGDQPDVTEEDLTKLRDEERQALQTLKNLESEREHLNAELASVHKELEDLEVSKSSLWQDVNDFDSKLQTYQNERQSVQLSHAYVSKQLESLKKTNVYNDTFQIWHEGPFGTINGFRMGRLPTQPVDWSEINAAMGQSLLLLDTMANKLRFTFKNYKLVPMGSFSRIEKIDGDKGTLELYGSGDLKGVLFWNRRFDNALVAFLHCLQQIGDYAEQRDSKFRLPYRIVKDKIGDTPIKLQFNQDETWTKALKYMLIDLKWILAFCCTRN
ncbi:autophagy protein Apg6-domain-containing protein [Fimicolochytrium jonesii]|uniref:autophagy protein Apg6-domain-containing protein n=1 Tax=Fimicolochytrium jonesii TaxID=1396493 RepID=UPI0022FE478C|nr:autophagy protein Apg6-domain-containing protein [Fimicolochytrium jonesii]KAI8817591.1 autophagy protein Apg6-domain-containing protein [Fimicolochytrium jonesii]